MQISEQELKCQLTEHTVPYMASHCYHSLGICYFLNHYVFVCFGFCYNLFWHLSDLKLSLLTQLHLIFHMRYSLSKNFHHIKQSFDKFHSFNTTYFIINNILFFTLMFKPTFLTSMHTGTIFIFFAN